MDLTLKVGADIANFNAQLQKMNSSMTTVSSTLKGLAGSLGLAFGISELAGITKRIFDLGVAQEQTNIAFETFLGSAEAAKTVLKDLTKFSIETPFTADQVTKAARTLLAFGMTSKDLLPTLKMLGDVASGTGKDFAELAVIYGQIRSTGRLMGQDLLQLINAGFNPLQVISQKTGKSVADLKKEMEAGLISFGMVEQAFRDATTEGGLFFNLMEKQSKSLGGLLSTIQGNIEEIGKKLFETNKGPLNDTFQNIADITSNVEGIASFFGNWLKMVMTVPRYAIEGINKIITAFKEYRAEQEKARKEALKFEQQMLFADLQSGAFGAEGTRKIQKRLLEIGALLNENAGTTEDAIESQNDGTTTQLSLLDQLEKDLKDLKDKQEKAFDASSVMSYGRQIEELSRKISALKAGKIEDPLDSLTRKKTTEQIYNAPEITDSLIPSMDEMNKRFAAQIVPIQMVRNEVQSLSEAYAALGNVIAVDLEPVLEGIAVSFGEAIGAMLVGAHGIEAIGSVLLGGIGEIATALGKAMIEFGVAAVALKALIKNPVTAIAAGVALVALGAALKSKASSIVSGGGGGGGGSFGTGRDRNPLTRIEYLGERINLTGEFKVKGQDLVAVITNQNRRDSRLTNKNG